MHHRQRGSALVIGLIMLILMMMLAVTSINMGRSSALISTNQQLENQAVIYAKSAIEDAISTERMFSSPDAIYLTPCNAALLNSKCIDVDGDGTPDITVQLAPSPSCVTAVAISNSQLDLSKTSDFGCLLGSTPAFRVEGETTGASLCSNSTWDVTAVATDNVTSATITVNEGVNVRVPTAKVTTTCPGIAPLTAS
jgi:Tfp pilus assembly protein PilX